VDVYRWQGDVLGNGRFVLEGATAPRPKFRTPTPFETYRDAGYACLTRGDWKEAVTAFQKALALKPDAACFYALGKAHYGSGVTRGSEPLRQAVAAYSRAVALDPKRVPALWERAQLYLFAEEYDRALADFTRIIQLEPEKFDGYLDRAQAYSEKGAQDKAIADVLRARRIVPQGDEYKVWGALCTYQYRAAKLSEAEASARRALAFDDTQNVPRVVLATVYARQGKQTQALKVVKDAQDHGLSYPERRDGIKEVLRLLKAQPDSSALKALLQALKGPENLEPSE
jgi:tetratricopeptide (TPR) repeat protein